MGAVVATSCAVETMVGRVFGTTSSEQHTVPTTDVSEFSLRYVSIDLRGTRSTSRVDIPQLCLLT